MKAEDLILLGVAGWLLYSHLKKDPAGQPLPFPGISPTAYQPSAPSPQTPSPDGSIGASSGNENVMFVDNSGGFDPFWWMDFVTAPPPSSPIYYAPPGVVSVDELYKEKNG